MKTLTTSLLACAFATAAASLTVACDRSNDASTTTTTSGTTGVNTVPGAPRVPADNTQLNARDNKTGSVTPIDQGNDQADLNTTQAIRKSMMSDDALSMTAKNAKVITSNGTITLRGPVKSEAEKQNIVAKAKANAGTNQVVDQLDIELTP